MQKVVSLLQSAKTPCSSGNVEYERRCIQEAINIARTIISPSTELFKDLNSCLEHLDYIERGGENIDVPKILESYNDLLESSVQIADSEIHSIVKDIPSDLIFKLLKQSVDHINRLEVGYAGFDKTKLNEMFVESVQKIIEEMSSKSSEMAKFVAEDYTTNQKAEKYGRD